MTDKRSSTINLNYIINVDSSDDSQSEITTDLGSLSVKWEPLPLRLTPHNSLLKSTTTYSEIHGSLPISVIQAFPGPTAIIRKTPFRVSLDLFPVSTRLSAPFEVRYAVSNLSKLHQQLIISVKTTSSLLFSGIEQGSVHLGPNETTHFGYTAIPLKAGKIMLPRLNVASARHNTWVIYDNDLRKRSVFVMP